MSKGGIAVFDKFRSYHGWSMTSAARSFVDGAWETLRSWILLGAQLKSGNQKGKQEHRSQLAPRRASPPHWSMPNSETVLNAGHAGH